MIVHRPEICGGSPCPFHHPSDHLMKGWPRRVRATMLVERVCPHGVGHPDPDSLAFLARRGPDPLGVHGCDGCCAAETSPCP